jgi:hypothetical protein
MVLQEVQMWTIDPHLRFLRKFTGHVQGRFLIRSCFGAPKDRFVLSGSEGKSITLGDPKWRGRAYQAASAHCR